MLLYAVMYAGFGVASPFLPAFVSARGLSAAQIGLMFGAGTAVRLLTAPLAGRTGDVLQGLRAVLVVCTALAASVTLGYLRRTALAAPGAQPGACRVAGAGHHPGGCPGTGCGLPAAGQRPPRV